MPPIIKISPKNILWIGMVVFSWLSKYTFFPAPLEIFRGGPTTLP